MPCGDVLTWLGWLAGKNQAHVPPLSPCSQAAAFFWPAPVAILGVAVMASIAAAAVLVRRRRAPPTPPALSLV